jgi:hypothetical protein
MIKLTESVPEKQQLLVDSSSMVIAKIHTAVSEGLWNWFSKAIFYIKILGCESIKETSETANTILTKVQEATNTMNNSTKESINSFTQFLDSVGKNITSDLGAHFQEVDVFLLNQEKIATVTIDGAEKFKTTSASSVVLPTGGTPKKKQFSPLRSLRYFILFLWNHITQYFSNTRNREEIKDEVRNRKRKVATVQQEDNGSEGMVLKSFKDEILACAENCDPQESLSRIEPDAKRETGLRAPKQLRKSTRSLAERSS